MDSFSPRSLKEASGFALHNAAYPPRKLALLHTGAAALVSLVLTVLHYLLSQQIGTTGGLAGIGTRTALSSVQTFLQLAANLALPFWEMGFLFCTIRLARQADCTPRDLMEGFRRVFPLLRLMLLELLLYGVLAFVSIQIVSLVFSLTPFALPMMEKMSALTQDAAFLQSGTIPQALLEELMVYLIPVYVLSLVLFAVVAIPLFYRFRFSRYAMMDTHRPGAFAALRISSHLMKGHCRQLFSLDLSYWWYYLLQLLIAATAYADLLLPAMGIPFSGDGAFFATFGLYLTLSLVLAWCFRAQAETTYACFYQKLLPPEKPTLPPV